MGFLMRFLYVIRIVKCSQGMNVDVGQVLKFISPDPMIREALRKMA